MEQLSTAATNERQGGAAKNMSRASSVAYQCKKLCKKRCCKALALAVFMQFVLLAIFLLLVNFDLLHPLQWLLKTLKLTISFSTWFSALPLICLVILYGIVLGQPYFAVPQYYATCFEMLLGTTVRRLIFFVLHLAVGFFTAFLYTSFLQPDYGNSMVKCGDNQNCLNSRYTFLLVAAVVISCYHFVRQYLCVEPQLQFPLIRQTKIVQIRALLCSSIYDSLLKSFFPTLLFALFSWLFGALINSKLSSLLGIDMDDSLTTLFGLVSNVRLLLFAWILSTQVLCNMHMMPHFFALMLTDPTEFVIERYQAMQLETMQEVTLVEALGLQKIPIIQSLAALQLYDISLPRNAQKRMPVFLLSTPGGHPYNWKQLCAQCLSIINGFIAELSKSLENIHALKGARAANMRIPFAHETREQISRQQQIQRTGLRPLMSMCSTPYDNNDDDEADQARHVNQRNVCQPLNDKFEQLTMRLQATLSGLLHAIPGYAYMLDEPENAKSRFLLSHSFMLVWLMQGLAGICVASLTEDTYGVVQDSLCEVIKSLMNLKLELDKLHNMLLNGKKMNANYMLLRNAVKRSLYQICTSFGRYMHDIILDPDDLRQLQGFLKYQET